MLLANVHLESNILKPNKAARTTGFQHFDWDLVCLIHQSIVAANPVLDMKNDMSL